MRLSVTQERNIYWRCVTSLPALRVFGSPLKYERKFGWLAGNIVELGGIETSRATERHAALLFRRSKVKGNCDFTIA